MFITRQLRRRYILRPDGVVLHPGLLVPTPLVRHDPAGNRLRLPPVEIAMDPSDPRTWRRPVVFT